MSVQEEKKQGSDWGRFLFLIFIFCPILVLGAVGCYGLSYIFF